MNQPLVSAIVTTKNSQDFIAACLQSIKNQSYSDIEIIVVDNYSTDRTKQLANQYTSLVYDHGDERSEQRNYGIGKSKGEYCIFVDSDMTLSPTVIEECINMCKGYVGLYIPEKILGNSFWGRVRNFERSFYNATVIDAVRFIPRKILDTIGGFDEQLFAAEDWDLDKKIRQLGKTAIIESPLFHNETDFSVHKYVSKKGTYMQGIKTYQIKWGNNDPDVKKQFDLYYRFIGVFIENGKWRQLVQHPVLAAGMLLLKTLVGYQYLQKSHE